MNEQSLKDKLHRASKELNLSFNACLRKLVLERFLVRLSVCEWREHFIFKGGMLLAQYLALNRETVDLDFLVRKLTANEPKVAQAMREIALVHVADNFTFSFLEISQLNHEHTFYPGFQASFLGEFGRIKERVTIDIGVGDVVTPSEESISLLSSNKKALFEDSVSLFVYPIEAIFAEKLHTLFARGARNSRMKDYYDVYLILESQRLPIKTVVLEALLKTFKNRNHPLEGNLLSFSESEFEILQKLWSAFYRGLFVSKTQASMQIPEKIRDVIERINRWLEDK